MNRLSGAKLQKKDGFRQTEAVFVYRGKQRKGNSLSAALECRTCSNQCLTCFVASELSEVLDEAASQILSFFFPLASAFVSITRVEDLRIYTRQFSRNYEVEERNYLGRSLVDRTVEDSVDDTTSVADRDTLACTVPASVYQVCLSTNFFHLLNQLFCVFSRMQAQESSTEASREGRSGFCDTTFCTSQLSSKA